MITVRLVRDFVVHGAEDFDDATLLVMHELTSLRDKALIDVDMTADRETQAVELRVTARANRWDDAFRKADSAIHDALAGAARAMPGWTSPVFDPNGMHAEPVSS